MARPCLPAVLLLALAATPALADPEPARPITQREPSAADVVATPATDLNLRKDEIPPILLAAGTDPYGLAGLRRCTDLAAEVARLDAVLGDDIDIAQAPGARSARARSRNRWSARSSPFAA